MRQPRFSLWLALSAAVIILDQASKAWLMSAFRLGESVTVTRFFDLVFVFNRGAAFSFLSSASGWQRWFFVALALVISAWILTLMRRHAHERLQPLALALVLGGALGNVIDRLIHGAVVDFLYFHIDRHYWPAFNVADSAISIGVVLMLWRQLARKK
ncbi:MAG TPA: signal peptidase II [Rhodocyclaceae bacterium]|nr:signal peptidase II [Rhodocyclaceae bacterium]